MRSRTGLFMGLFTPLFLAGLLLVAGCAAPAPGAGAARGEGAAPAAEPGGRRPRAHAPVTRVDLGDLPPVADMRQARLQRFSIKNEGTADLRLSEPQVKTLEGC